MNNKGFIATSLIYSFFLIFITLFLTIIADYLQNKVLLNTIEKGIKDDINSTMGIQDFEVGSFIGLSTEKDNCVNFDYYVISKVDYNSNTIILYSLNTSNELEDNNNDILTDIDTGYMNATYFNKIFYSTKEDKKVKSYKFNYKNNDGSTEQLCVKPRENNDDGTLKSVPEDINTNNFLNQFITTEGYISNNCNDVNVFRKKFTLYTDNQDFFDNSNRALKCNNTAGDGAGFTYLKKVK